MTQLSPEAEILRQFRGDFEFFARLNLKIKDKEGKLVPFILNTAQRYVEMRAQDMLKRKGYVRLLVLKGRQQGISTWAQGRAYHKTSLWPNQSAFVLSHQGSTSDKIFEITERFHLNNEIRPLTGAANAKELKFSRLHSDYEVATAGSKEVGRGGTRQFFHGSEVAFWDNPETHFAASVQSVGPFPGTWIILESTANGVTGEFYRRWQNAVAGHGQYEAVFIPWFWQPEYRTEPEPGFELQPYAEEGELSEVEYAAAYGCDLAQMKWRRDQIVDSGAHKFKQEYPATAEEAFQSADTNSFIPAITVMKARKREVEGGGPLIIGVDPAGPGGDRFAVAFRRGHACERIEWRDKIGHVAAVEWLKDIIDQHRPAAVFIDSGGMGAPMISFLKNKGPKYDKVTHPVNFGSPSQARMADPKKKKAAPVNRRAEMWLRMKNWLAQEDGVRIPDNNPLSGDKDVAMLGDHLQGDLTSVWTKTETNNDLLLASKSDMKAKGIRSPDLADALALTFASTVYVEEAQTLEDRPITLVDKPVSPEYNGFGGAGGALGWMSH